MCRKSLKARWRREPKVSPWLTSVLTFRKFLRCRCTALIAFQPPPLHTHPTGVYVPVGGKKLLTFMDDLNMPAKDTFGSQPPLELMRHWIDYGFWYDRQKQTVKQIKVRLLCP